ncbi:hypothetical protein WR25_15081 [Diploscapter pachys]|uniref:Uncharacterized protein n=1 Tax=Diploscapter pachys TaxID=2018661 RepID=A0A2A2LL73_9BILA|nr:hypothetical protein WR25_15081 [Diploscapter pachys]
MKLQENAAAKYRLLEGSANNNPLIITPLDLSSLNDTQPCHSHSHSDGNESSGISSYSQNEKSDDSENIEVAIPNESSSTRHPLVSPRSYSGKREIFIESPRSLRTPGKDGLGKYLNSAGTSMIAKLLDNNNLPYASQSDSETESTADANGGFHGVWAREVRLFSLIFFF